MNQDPSGSSNRLRIPSVLLDAANSPLSDEIAIVLEYIEDLPSDLQAAFGEHFETEHLDSLRGICDGLQKIRRDVMPTEEELDLIAHRPQDVFRELAEGLDAAATATPISLDLADSVEQNMVRPLRAASQTFLPGAAAGVVTWWFEALQDDPDGPFTTSPHP